MTNLRQAAEMALKAFEVATTHFARDRQEILAAMQALRQALAEPDTGTDRGAWSDVPDATKWVDELRGGEDLDEPPNSTTDVVEPVGEVQIEQMERPFNAGKVVLHFYGESPPVGTKLYAAPPKPDLLNQTCCECGRSGGYALYCGDCWSKASKREWVGLTDEEIERDHYFPFYYRKFARAIEAKLREKNCG